MPVTFHDLYNQKQEIENHSFTLKEAHLRLIISRGYYASFSHAQKILENKNNYKINVLHKNPDTGKSYASHQKFYESLIADSNENLNKIGQLLKKHHILRVKSDYKLTKKVTDLDKLDAEKYLDECKKRIAFFLANGPIPYP